MVEMEEREYWKNWSSMVKATGEAKRLKSQLSQSKPGDMVHWRTWARIIELEEDLKGLRKSLKSSDRTPVPVDSCVATSPRKATFRDRKKVSVFSLSLSTLAPQPLKV
mmetsp:Transcript_31885/g.49857  ORF Transcript_31885/g.49857 Transcript_31885/m.49857 type:complete len:108 (+) Transcript_31885:96-419(+)